MVITSLNDAIFELVSIVLYAGKECTPNNHSPVLLRESACQAAGSTITVELKSASTVLFFALFQKILYARHDPEAYSILKFHLLTLLHPLLLFLEINARNWRICRMFPARFCAGKVTQVHIRSDLDGTVTHLSRELEQFAAF